MKCEPYKYRDEHLGTNLLQECCAEMIQTESTTISDDAMMVAMLANSNWAKMEREARMFSLIPEESLWEMRNSSPE
jgi:hypothetical protein